MALRIDSMMARWFPNGTHPYALLEKRLDSFLTGSEVVLDIGSGRNAPNLQKLIGKAANLIGIDPVDLAVDLPPSITRYQASANAMPMIADQSVDLAYSRSTFEHLEDPLGACREIARVLKPGGRLLILTPSIYDYASVIAMIVPNRFHPTIVAATEGRDEADTFPTYFRANSRRRLRILARKSGLALTHSEYQGQYPSYMMFSPAAFWLASQYERLLRAWPLLHFLRGWIYAEMTKSS